MTETALHTIHAAELQRAFLVFDDASRQLADSYEGLHREVARLNAEVMVTNGRLRIQLAENQAMARALARSERLATLGTLSATLAHQLRTPLAGALLYASQLAQPGLPDDQKRQFAGEVVARLRELEVFIQGTLDFASGRSEWRQPVDLATLVADACQLIQPQAELAGVTLSTEAPPAGSDLPGSRGALLSMLLNLLDNAILACSCGGCVRIGLRHDTEGMRLSVADDGCGMDFETCARLFEPYFTTRGDGHGLGLAYVKSVAEAHGGSVLVESQPGSGSVFTLILPRQRNEREGA
ncbi:MAG: HAMP domain-containing sensor histidine kinase [Burkholderiales bacterium]|nr:HAMP domain-containing sensor histidine kinase [Burkholderiales bacterium]